MDIKTYLEKFSKSIYDSSIPADWGYFDDSLLEPLLNLIKSGTSYEKYNATNVIRQMYFHGKYHEWILAHTIEPMIQNLQDEFDQTRGYTVVVLSAIGDQRALASIISLATDPSDYVRWVVSWGLGEFGDKRAIPALEWIRDNDKSFQMIMNNDKTGANKEFNRDVAIKSIAKLS
ncbi:MAG: HEAT repeat domain-containing protein [Chloroflexota bacterium]